METSLQLNEGEKLILECRPEKALIYNLMFKSVAQTIFFFVVAIVYVAFNDKTAGLLHQIGSSAVEKFVFVMVVIFFIYFGIIYATNAIRVSHYRYIFTDQRCIIYFGFIGVNKQVVPYNRVADVNIQQGTLEALMGLSSVFIDEQAMNYSNGAWVRGLSRDTAEHITKIVSDHISRKQA